MESELNWTRSCINQLDDAARTTRWHLEQIAERRAGITQVWNDACALSVSQRYLDPLADDAAGALATVVLASRDLHASAEAVQRACGLFDTAARLGRAVRGSISEGQSLLRATSQQADNAGGHVEASRHHATRTQSLLAQADSVGLG